MTPTKLTHLWSENTPISDVQALLPDGMQLIYRDDPSSSAIESAQQAQGILAITSLTTLSFLGKAILNASAMVKHKSVQPVTMVMPTPSMMLSKPIVLV